MGPGDSVAVERVLGMKEGPELSSSTHVKAGCAGTCLSHPTSHAGVGVGAMGSCALASLT